MLSHRNHLIILSILLVLSALFVLFLGLDNPFYDPIEQQILLQLRLPTVVTAFIVGAGLAVSSASLQVLLRNPLADPGIIGISSGASLFAALFLLLGSGMSFSYIQYLLPLFCFFGALLSTFAIYAISRRMVGGSSGVILAGIAISTISGAIIAWLHFFSDAQSMRNLTFWLMGSLHQADWSILMFAAPALLGLLAYTLTQGKQLNWYYFGGNAAHLAGLNIKTFNKKMLLVCALMVGIAVSIAGSIAFIGLLVPHLLRNFAGFDNRFILPASALLGGILLMCVVLVSNSLGGISVPVSMLTATLGGPVFLYSIYRLGRNNL
ncbi:MAG: iron complex transport system permease protein [Paraglaciecola sp.]|jgi:iron complex transport system permease protein